MNRKSILALFITLVMIGTSVFPVFPAFGQAPPSEKPPQKDQEQAAREAASLRIIEHYREDGQQPGHQTGKGRKPEQTFGQKQERPEWAKEALRHSLAQVQRHKEKYGVQNAEAEFQLMEAMKDGRGYLHVRLAKLRNGVEVFGGEQIAHLDDRNVLQSVSGWRFKDVEIDTTPKIDEAQAIAAAKAAMGRTGEMTTEPTAKLVILPHQIMKDDDKAAGATLVYKVDLQSTKGGVPVGSYSYFVSAEDGHIVWRLNNRPNEDGIGFAPYNDIVTVNTTRSIFTEGTYTLRDPDRGDSQVFDANDNNTDADNDGFIDDTAFDAVFTGDDNLWGALGDSTNRETVAVDVHYGVAQSWDYFRNRHNRDGADGNGTAIRSLVHFREDPAQSWNNASGGGNILTFGDGDGVRYGPNVSIDIVGHEFTHCVIEETANLIYSGESGAINESYADIFGTAVGFYSGKDEDYLQGDDIIIPGSGGVARRDLQNPTSIQAVFADGTNFILPDHYSNRFMGTEDNGGVHYNSSIMNHVYYLLVEGGTHRNGTFVPAIGRRIAEDIFYTVLVAFLTPFSRFESVAEAMVEVASIYGPDERHAVEAAWFAVGVLTTLNDPLPTPDLTRSRIVLYNYLGDGLTTRLYNDGYMLWLQDYSGAFAPNWTQIVNMGPELFYYNGANGMAAVGRIAADGTHATTRSFARRSFKSGWSSITWHEGYLFFYDKRDGSAQIGQMTASGYQTIRDYPATPTATRWTHLVSAQGYLFHYNQDNGQVVVGDWAYYPSVRWRQVASFSIAPDYSHIVDGGVRSGANTGILFYNRNNATYEVGDFDSAGNFTMRAGNSRWAYNFIRLGYTDIIRVGEGLLLYNENERRARVGYLLTPGECDRFGREPFQTIKDLSEAYFPAYYSHIASH